MPCCDCSLHVAAAAKRHATTQRLHRSTHARRCTLFGRGYFVTNLFVWFVHICQAKKECNHSDAGVSKVRLALFGIVLLPSIMHGLRKPRSSLVSRVSDDEKESTYDLLPRMRRNLRGFPITWIPCRLRLLQLRHLLRRMLCILLERLRRKKGDWGLPVAAGDR